MKIKNLGMLLQQGNRAKAYLQNLTRNGLVPNYTILVQNPDAPEALDTAPSETRDEFYDPSIPEIQTLEQYSVPYGLIIGKSCNEPQVVEALRQRPEDYFVFAGFGILREVFDAGKQLIHVHPGKLPEYRGSTCHHYSTVAEGKWYCTAFIMKPGIDEGDLITQREFLLPPRGIDSARIYDPFARSETLVDVVKQLAQTGGIQTFKQDLSQGVDFYINHPLIHYMAWKTFQKQNDK
jgi:methionyl-tRNA formyltransferase